LARNGIPARVRLFFNRLQPHIDMYLRLIGRQARLARTLALASLLLLTAAQLLEAGHSHSAQDTAEHCLLCKSPADSVALVSHPAQALPGLDATPAVEHPRTALQFFPSLYLARGPPLYT
jgi:hypothetical protein